MLTNQVIAVQLILYNFIVPSKLKCLICHSFEWKVGHFQWDDSFYITIPVMGYAFEGIQTDFSKISMKIIKCVDAYLK